MNSFTVSTLAHKALSADDRPELQPASNASTTIPSSSLIPRACHPDVSVVNATLDHMGTLTPKDLAILRFEGQRWKHPGAKEAAVLDTFGLNLTAYYARLGRLLELPEALAYAPQTVNRLRRLREARKAVRTASRSPSAL